MPQYVFKKIAIVFPVLFLVSVVVFVLLRAALTRPTAPDVGSNTMSIIEQYVQFLASALRGDFGRSYISHRRVSELVSERLLNTLKLGGVALLLSYLFAIPLGVIAAVRHRTWADHLSVSVAYAGQSIPGFLLALFLILIFAYKLRLFPASGYKSLKHLVLPAATLAFQGLAISVRIVRASMLEVLGMDFIRALRAKGLSERRVIWQHALKNALIPVISLFALRLGWLLGGAVAVEVVFAWPGVGRFFNDTATTEIYTVIQAVTLILAAGVIIANLLADILYAAVNPRIKH
jgi:ABC-type dipeptide/oligopeptide/nickel transport system permease component